MRLCRDSIAGLPDDIARPGYHAASVGIGIVHLGIGAFHRAHQAVYVDDCLAAGAGDWRILGVSLRSAGVRDQLVPQDGLYTLLERSSGGERLRIIGSVADVLVAAEDPARVIAAIANPAIHIVSLTITEKGYCHDPATGALDDQHADIVHDRANPTAPRSAIGFLATGLAARMAAGAGPLTILSCDNLPHNGAVLRSVLTAFVASQDPALAVWLAANVRFPATMVDRIVPATTDADRTALAQRLGMDDTAMVKAEPFSQWVIEDDFAGPRPPFETVGAQLVADVRPFELAKLRMLNGAHSTIAYLGLMRGYSFVHQAIADPAIAATVRQLMDEAAATLPTVPGLDTSAYAAALLERFANRALEHRLAQIAMDGSQKLPQRLIGIIVDTHAAGRKATAAAVGLAAWMRHLAGPHVDDPLAQQLRVIGKASDDAALLDATLALEPVFGTLGSEPRFRTLLAEALAVTSAPVAA
jgi:fructuronate reductase